MLRYTYHPDGSVETMTNSRVGYCPMGMTIGGRLISVADRTGEIVGYCHTPRRKGKGDLSPEPAYENDRDGNLHMLTETKDGEETSYLYDLCGNRLEKRKGGRTERYRYNGENQLVRRVAGGDAWDYTYDLQGNLVREAGPEGERQYLYDTENRQIRVLSGGKEIQEERYDGEGMRVGLSVNGKKSTFLYGNGDLYAEFDETGADVSRYIWGYGLAGLGYQEKFYGVHRDEQLSTGWITGGAGSLENAYEYDAFGVLLGSYGKVPGRLLYGGPQYDTEVEQYYLRARYYNPVIGRFMQADTYRGDGLNLYAYCANNPVMYYDPSGRNAACNHATDAEENVQQENVTGKKKNQVQNFDIVNYGDKNPGLENHHGVLDVWATHNINGYKSRASKSTSIALTPKQHSATKAVYRNWLFEKTGKKVGGKVDWKTISPIEVQALSESMFDAANVPASARSDYYREFNRYIYNLEK